MTTTNDKSAIQAEQLRQLLASSRVSILTSALLAVVLAYMQSEVIPPSVLSVWLSLVILVSIIRSVITFIYIRTPVERETAIRSRLLSFRAGVLIAGLVWGSAGYFLFPAHDPEHQMFLIFMLAGLSAGGVVSYSAEIVGAIGFSMAVLIPLVVRLYVEGGNLSLGMAVAGSMYLGFLVVTLRYISKNVTENIVLRLDASAREEAVRASEEHYRLLLGHSPVGIFHYDTDLIITYCNERFAEMLHNTTERLIGLDMKLLQDKSILPAMNKVWAGETGHYEGQYRATFSNMDGWVDFVCAPSRDSKGKIVGGIGITQDITERRLAEMTLRKRTGELELHNRTLAQINQHRTLPEMLDGVVRQVEALHPGMICSIMVLDKDGKTLHHGAAPSLPDFFNSAIDGIVVGEGVGSCGTAAFRGECVIVEDVQQHTFWTPFRELARQADVQSCWSHPIKNNQGRVIGTFAVYHKQPTYPSEGELTQIEQYANLVQIVLESAQAQNELRIAATAFDTKEGMLITDADNNILRVNQAFADITGYALDEVVGRNPRIFNSGRQDDAFYEAMWQELNTNGAWEGEIWDRRKSGEIFPQHLSITVVKDAAGNVTNYVSSTLDITQRKSAEEEIRMLAFYDSLTRLPNRRLLLDRLQHALAASSRSGRKGAILFIDLDNFKNLNDTLGHAMGDLLLQQVAQRLCACVRAGDTVARLGGDEFVVMLEDLDAEVIEAAAQTEVVGEKILQVLNQEYLLEAHEHHSTPSIGATLFNNHEVGIEDLLKQADIAMYQAKKAGRNTLRFFDSLMQDAINTRSLLEADLHKAMSDQQFNLYYQIQVDILNRPLGAEALIRWKHPKRGMVSPAEFIPLAEDTGLILPIGSWVLQTACAQLKVWQQHAHTRELVLAVNVSAKQFRQPGFISQVKDAVREHEIDAHLLKLELTESMLLENIEDMITTMQELKTIGVQLSLDDFGTGYSSLQYLKRLPLDQLKIDQSFVRDLATDNSDKAIVSTIIAMAHSLNLDVIAEGVETEDQRQFLREKGCMQFQGYLFSKPVQIAEFMAMLQ